MLQPYPSHNSWHFTNPIYQFLNFFKMAIKLFSLMAFFATIILLPINQHYRDFQWPWNGNETSTFSMNLFARSIELPINGDEDISMQGGHGKKGGQSLAFWWAYVVLTYFFVALTIYFINWETFRVIKFRQDYLGTQSTITDRTFRLTGIPTDMRDEEQLKELIERLGIGSVESVTLCRNWKQIDDLMDQRTECLHNLEACWAQYLKKQQQNGKSKSSPSPENQESSTIIQEEDGGNGETGRLLENNLDQPAEDERPKVTIRFGPFKLRSRKLDAIDYYEEKLRRLDGKVAEARKKKYKPTDMALVTMDSVASCQMVIQARIDPRPGRLLTKVTPAPSDLVWRNTYAPRGIRRLKSWTITIFITFLTLLWIIPTATLASLMSICTINDFFPDFAKWLVDHQILHSLLQNGVPTLVVSLLNVAVPYLYDWLSNCQGMISQSDVELSVVSKNFFFTFFNTFFVFTLTKTGFDFWSMLKDLEDFLKDTSLMAKTIASFVENMSIFYTSFIMLQGIGLMPFRILEVGSVFLYPFYRMMSATPRDYAELEKPPMFQYGFYLPTALLVFNLCLIYSVLEMGFAILIVGVIYFSLGFFTFKYMLLYAMDQPQHATGGAWRIICYRIVIGLVVFEVVMFGLIVSNAAYITSLFVLPTIPFTVWYSYYFKRRFEPLTRNIALRALYSDEEPNDQAVMDDTFADEEAPRPSQGIMRRASTLDEFKEKDLKFVNPSLVVP